MIQTISEPHTPKSKVTSREQVPPKIWDHASGVVVMSTPRLINPNRVKIDGVEEMLAAQKRVNAKFKAAKAKDDGTQYGIYEFIAV